MPARISGAAGSVAIVILLFRITIESFTWVIGFLNKRVRSTSDEFFKIWHKAQRPPSGMLPPPFYD
jgi:hypothetical protein